jgi:hypothetical protein
MSKSWKGVCLSQTVWESSSKCDARFQEQSVCVPFHSHGTPRRYDLGYGNDVLDKGRYMKQHPHLDASCQYDHHPDALYRTSQRRIAAPKGEMRYSIVSVTRIR